MTSKTETGEMPMNARQLFEPMLAESGADLDLQDLTDSGEWYFQPKYDGMRVMAFKGKSRYYVLNRSGEDVTHRFPEVLEKLEKCPQGTLIDGEIVVLDEETGRPDFSRLSPRINLDDMNQIFIQQTINPATLVVFDLVGMATQLINTQTLEERLSMLEHLPVDQARIEENGVALFEEMREKGWEGIIAKRKDSKYEVGARSGTWRKFKFA